MHKQSRTNGIIISYIVTAFRAFSQFFLTTIYLRKLGLDEYGFYQYVYSVASYAIILDFGISSVVNKFSIDYREKNDTNGVENSLFMCLLMTFLASAIIIIIGIGVIVSIPTIFGQLSNEQYKLTHKLLIIIILYIITLLFQHYFEGVLLSNEQYTTLKLIALFQIFVKFCIVLCLIYSNFGSISIAISDLSAALVCLCFSIVYSVVYLKVRIRYHYVDKKMIKAASKLAGSLCIQSVILYINTSIDKYLLGRLVDNVAVTIYTVAMNFSSFFDEIPSVIQRMYLPQAVKLVANDADGEQLTDFVIKPGRFQFILCGGMLGGFVLFGRQLIVLWVGEKTIFAWWISLLLLFASLLPLIQNVCLAILTAKNKRMFRSYVLAAVTALNFLLTIILVKKYGLIGAPIGTFVALILGNNIAMNWYYKNKIGLNITRLFKSILKGIMPCVIFSTIICTPLLFVDKLSVLWLICECFIFGVIYVASLWIYGLNNIEKEMIQGMISKRIGRK